MTNENKEDLPKPILIEDLGYLYSKEDSKKKARYGIYKCGFCGNDFKAPVRHINSGNTKSCGCYRKRRASDTQKTHGLFRTRLYRIWTNMKDRTLNPKYTYYLNYGGRGITICDEWKNDVKSFYDWAMSNGYSEGLSIDRIDNDGNYEPNNCRWITRTIQNRNQRMKKNNTSGFKGVYFNKSQGKYLARIRVNGKRAHLGSFSTPKEAGIAYNNYIIENNLEGFILNEIPEEYLEKGDYK